MAQERVKPSAIVGVGFDYQVLHGVLLLAEWIDSPGRYRRVRFECNDREIAPQSLDDIVAERDNGLSDYWQIKYTPNQQDNLLSWDWLLRIEGKTSRARSNLRKWFDAMKQIEPSKLGSAQLVTNRIPDAQVEGCLSGGDRLDLSKAPKDVLHEIERQFPSLHEVQAFLSRLRVQHSDKNHLSLSAEVKHRLARHTDVAGIERLQGIARAWAYLEDEPADSGWISLDDVLKVISVRRPEPIPESFAIPRGYRVPDEAFHSQLLSDLKNTSQSIFTIVGPPGRGKSTYLSQLCADLESAGTPVIRHHYFLSRTDRTHDRLTPYIVKESLLGQIATAHPEVQANTSERGSLSEAIAACGTYYANQGQPFVVVMDGLDHVWREHGHDTRPLTEIFSQLIPTPANVLLIIGTQPVSDEQLPETLLAHSPRSLWRPLPPMSGLAVMDYLSALVSSGRLALRHNSDDLAEGSHQLHVTTGGHPLHVIYASEQLISAANGLSQWSVEQIPGDLSHDATTYYASLWQNLKYSQRDILILLTEYRFHWPSDAFIGSHLIQTCTLRDLRSIEHLLHSTAAGLEPFHDSLVVFVQSRDEYRERVAHLAPRVEHWLESDAPSRLRNTWLWLVQARLGRPHALISGLTRDWILDRVSDGYPIDVPIDLLAEAEVISFDTQDYAGANRLRHLKTRLLNGPEFQLIDATRLKNCSWRLSSDDAVLAEAFASRANLSPLELAVLGQALLARDEPLMAQTCGAEALRRHQTDTRFSVRHHRASMLGELATLCSAFADLETIDLSRVSKDGALNKNKIRLLESFVDALARKQDLDKLFSLHHKLTSKARKKVVEDAAILVASLNSISIHLDHRFEIFKHSSFVALWRVAVDSTSLPNVLTPSYSNEWQQATDVAPLRRFLHEWFFGACLTSVAASGKYSWVEYPDPETGYRAETITYVNALLPIAAEIGSRMQRGDSIGIVSFYELLRDLPVPDEGHASAHYGFSLFRRALLDVAIGCHAISAGRGGPPQLSSDDLEALSKNTWFDLREFRSWYAASGMPWLRKDAATLILRQGNAEVTNHILQTNDAAELALELCEIALLHEDHEAAKKHLRQCWEFVLGYGWRKDTNIITALEAVEHLCPTAPNDCLDILLSLAPQVHHVTDYTDGDETRHALRYADDLLGKLDRDRLASKYATHVHAGDWSYADSALSSLFLGDLNSPLLHSIALTGLPGEALSALAKREIAGTDGARELTKTAKDHLGIAPQSTPTEDSSEPTTLKFSANPENYPPTSLELLLHDLAESKTFDAYNYLPHWYDHWSARGCESKLLEALQPHFANDDLTRNDLSRLLDRAFESTVRLKGKKRAFPLIVKAQRELGGWSDFMEQSRTSQLRLQRAAELYPELADKFVSQSCYTWLRSSRQPSSRVIPGERLVFFLVCLGRKEEAAKLANQMARSIIEDTRTLPLTRPTWS